ncbi:tol-pal system protein YbgF [Methylomarinum sp. Ch1-1]|uniref:Cell division coordinator CpoB n=1 Tax=Methylomarinum roseum TaxID=3067653 RepID=A0AAU7NU71_9GAMM|nr:tol-pal system protein YbgF [Methylomarinum sp. Ch1-1]MDP4519408.1 tol-pal system protein YbgF [Methylomarinum sp. Ch1-1]
MNKKYLLLLPLCTGVSAEPRSLPPVIDNSTYPGGAAYSSDAPSSNALYEVLGRLEQLQHEVQQLRGVVEEQAQAIENLKNRQSNIYSDLDQRLQALSSGSQEGAPALPPTPVSPAPSRIESTKVASPQAPASQPVTVNQKQLYREAYETLRNGHNTQAIAAFKDLLNQFPAGEYADNAQYWLGEAYKVNQDIESARVAFTKVIEIYPNSPKVPDALLKLGYIEFDQNNIAKARDYLTQVSVQYPGSTAAHLAAKKLMQLDQQ